MTKTLKPFTKANIKGFIAEAMSLAKKEEL